MTDPGLNVSPVVSNLVPLRVILPSCLIKIPKLYQFIVCVYSFQLKKQKGSCQCKLGVIYKRNIARPTVLFRFYITTLHINPQCRLGKESFRT